MGFSLGSVGKGVGSIFGMGGGGAAGDAGKAMAKGSKKAGALYDPAYQDIKGMYNPYIDTGAQSMGMLQSGTANYNSPLMRNFALSDFSADPGYQFRLQSGADALQGQAASRGNLFSGATGKALTQYNQDFASNEYQNAYNRYNQNQEKQFGNLYKLGAMGMQGVGNLTDAKMWNTEGKGNAIMGVANANASKYLGKAAQKQQGFDNLLSLGNAITKAKNPTPTA